MTITTEMSGKPTAALSGAGLPWEPHEACLAWREMSAADLSDLANDISANGLRDPITLTADGFLLDGRNRALACIMAGVDPTTAIDDGDPWLFSLSRNKHRRHMSVDQIAMVAATMAKSFFISRRPRMKASLTRSPLCSAIASGSRAQGR
jgi:hypothetical protein